MMEMFLYVVLMLKNMTYQQFEDHMIFMDGSNSIFDIPNFNVDMVQESYVQPSNFEEGQVFEGKVISIKEFGAFIEFAPGKEGMVHISKISKERINRVEDVLTLGDKVKCVCLGKDKMGRISFSIKDCQ